MSESVLSAPLGDNSRAVWPTLLREGFRLFFPLCAVHVALWPLLWVFLHQLNLPMAQVPPGLWHAQEMLVGGFGAALIGFVLTAVPEWTDTPHLSATTVLALAVLWALARIIGLVGADALGIVAGLADAVWFTVLFLYLLGLSWRKRSTQLLSFAGWIAALAAAAFGLRMAMWLGDVAAAQQAVRIVVLAFSGLLGLALARITVAVTNLVLDPTQQTSPFRPHPGRMNLAPGLVALALAGEALSLSVPVTGFLWIAAGAAFLDRVGEAFVGREAFRIEIAMLAAACGLAGSGLMLTGASRLGAPCAETSSIHVIVMGGLGSGVLAVMSIAGRLHTGQPLKLGVRTALALGAILLGTALRVLPDLGWLDLPGPAHGVSALVWACGLLLWLSAYWPALSNPKTVGARQC